LRLVNVTIQSSAFPSLPGQAVNIGIFVEPAIGTAEPTGTVHLTEGSTDLGTLPLKQAQTAITRTYLESGAHVLTAEYSGDANYCSIIGTFGQQVNHLTPSVALNSSAASAPYGSPVTLTAQ